MYFYSDQSMDSHEFNLARSYLGITREQLAALLGASLNTVIAWGRAGGVSARPIPADIAATIRMITWAGPARLRLNSDGIVALVDYDLTDLQVRRAWLLIKQIANLDDLVPQLTSSVILRFSDRAESYSKVVDPAQTQQAGASSLREFAEMAARLVVCGAI
ncbi:hypothetical protein CU669_16905 [Paramagnetospirillum kuznetsovii]|uniref:Uncharacterized protein n=1 Tax=Paramagnetospirillum kuznetsovii TaxID=2053833 RepID=A0A364NUS9_9PROT|nr:hypothetical protein [Paramagnetospirillum kuznetsovii]RAU20760.1 hypothetical protein CU669_16905 [Paramagnetospirillum kuznetsovii]